MSSAPLTGAFVDAFAYSVVCTSVVVFALVTDPAGALGASALVDAVVS